MEQFSVTILGCASAKPTFRHNPTSQVIDFRGNLFMVDCGEWTQMQMIKMNIKPGRLRRIFISHLHGDHCYGLPGLLSTLALSGHNGTVSVHLPKEGVDLLKPLVDFTVSKLSVEFIPYEYGNNIIYEDKSITVNTVPLKHRKSCCGFVFREKEKLRHINREMIDFYCIPLCYLNSIKEGNDYVKTDGTVIPNERLTTAPSPSRAYAFISDTLPLKAVANEVKGIDLLYHEATFDSSLKDRAKETCHSTAADAANIAKMAGVKKLMIGHFSSRYTDDSLLLKEAQAVFPETILANEGLTVNL